MKTITIAFLLLSNLSIAQLYSDRYGLEVGNKHLELFIINQLKNDNNSFVIKSRTNGGKTVKCKFSYADSVLCENCHGEKISYRMHNDRLDWLPTQKDSIDFNLDEDIVTESDSANCKLFTRYRVIKQDTALVYHSTTTFDSLRRPVLVKSKNYMYDVEYVSNFTYRENTTEELVYERRKEELNWESSQTIISKYEENQVLIHELNSKLGIKEIIITIEKKQNKMNVMNVLYYEKGGKEGRIRIEVK